ncbi:MAG TPA: Fur family transcriptional regulator [Gemmatimonadales bacterium]|nr:Fur family transcriptional regulator [Gemmatimonadales bacterium]
MDAPGHRGLTDREVAERLRRGGLRVTRPRLAVYRALAALGGHRSAEDVVAELRRRRERVSRMSVYNALATLRGVGLLMQANAGPGGTLYETRAAWHHHFVCRRCGRVLDVPCVRGRRPCLSLPAGIGRAEEAQIVFRGVCRDCG